MNELNVFTNSSAPAKTGGYQSVTTAMVTARQAQEVQAAMIVAKQFPRDPFAATARILEACTRPSLAENATYSYSRGGTEVTGPSIHLAKCIAQMWGNIDFGYTEMERTPTETKVMAHAWDLETNTRESRFFTVPHLRDTRKGSVPLTDSRDIYEHVANQAARRVRACILGIIPDDVVDAAMKQCNTTLACNKTPLPDRIKDMVEKFAEFEITPDQLAGFIGKNVDAFTAQDVVRLGKIYRSIKDGIVGNDYFINRMKESAPAADPAPEPTPEPPTQEEQATDGSAPFRLSDL